MMSATLTAASTIKQILSKYLKSKRLNDVSNIECIGHQMLVTISYPARPRSLMQIRRPQQLKHQIVLSAIRHFVTHHHPIVWMFSIILQLILRGYYIHPTQPEEK